MKVVHVETGRHLYGGAQQVVYLAGGLQRRGIQSTIVCQQGSAISALASHQGLATHHVPCGGDLDIRYLFRLRKYLDAARPDIVHCHSRRGADFLGGRAAQHAKIPAVLSRRVDSRENHYLEKLKFAPYRKIIAISDNVASKLRQSPVAAARVTTIRSAVDADALASAGRRDTLLGEFGVGAHHVVAAIAAQFIQRKGHRFMLQAMPELCRAHPEFRLLLFGEGSLEAQLRNQADQLGVGEHVHFAGFRDNLDQLLGATDLLIHPALQEGLGVVMLKAAAAGLPVVAFDIAGAKEAVVAEHTGLLVTPGDADALLQAVTYLIENPSVRESMGQAGKTRMRESFSIDEMVDKHLTLYESIVKE